MAYVRFNGELINETMTEKWAVYIADKAVNELTAFDALPYTEKRKKEYPDVGDVMDEICKALDYIIVTQNIDNCEEFRNIQEIRTLIKEKYPKP